MIALIEAKAKRAKEERERSKKMTFEIARLVLLEHCTFVDAGARFGICATSARERVHSFCRLSNPDVFHRSFASTAEWMRDPTVGQDPCIKFLRRNGKRFFKRGGQIPRPEKTGVPKIPEKSKIWQKWSKNGRPKKVSKSLRKALKIPRN